jgi:post-segregation antitoxin (ccd killing protein)
MNEGPETPVLNPDQPATDSPARTFDAKAWRERNRTAMASYDAFVEKAGLILGDLRTF